jgi:hypothetical protein
VCFFLKLKLIFGNFLDFDVNFKPDLASLELGSVLEVDFLKGRFNFNDGIFGLYLSCTLILIKYYVSILISKLLLNIQPLNYKK